MSVSGAARVQAEGVAPADAALGRRAARETAGGRILADLRRRILDLSLAPGRPLIDKELTAAYRVSRTPVREALIRLAEEGLVEIAPQSGTFVARIPVGALAEAVVVRTALESAAVRHAVAKASGEALEGLRRIVARQEAFAAIADGEGFHEADEAFHAAIAVASGHPGLWRVAQQAKLQIDRCRRLTLPVPGRMTTVVAEHRDILAALEARDVERALAAMERHLSAVIPDAAALQARFPHYFA